MVLVLVGVLTYWQAGPIANWFVSFLGGDPAAATRIVVFVSLIEIGFFIYGPVALIGIQALNLVPKNAAGTAAGFVGLFGYLFGDAILAKIVMGAVADSKLGWNATFWMFAVACILAAAFCATTWRQEKEDMYDLVWGYNTNPMSCWKDEYFNNRWTAENRNSTISADGKSLVVAGTGSYNPYRNLYENINSSNKDHLVGQVGFTVHFTPHLTLTAKTGLDQKLEFRTKRFPKLTAGYENGYYAEQTLNAYELNSDFLLRYNNSWLDDRLTFSAAFGGNNMREMVGFGSCLQRCWNYHHFRPDQDIPQVRSRQLGPL